MRAILSEMRLYVTSILVFGLLFLLLEFLFYRVMPYSYWFEYEIIEPYQRVYDLGDEPFFISKSVRNDKLDVVWKDVLKCNMDSNLGVGYQYFAYYESSAQTEKTTSETEHKPRRFAVAGPLEPASCYLEAKIEVTLRYGVKKTQLFKTTVFRFE